MKITLEFNNWTLQPDNTLMLTAVEAEGTTLAELLDDATAFIETWHGESYRQVDIGELSQSDYEEVELLLTQKYNEAKGG